MKAAGPWESQASAISSSGFPGSPGRAWRGWEEKPKKEGSRGAERELQGKEGVGGPDPACLRLSCCCQSPPCRSSEAGAWHGGLGWELEASAPRETGSTPTPAVAPSSSFVTALSRPHLEQGEKAPKIQLGGFEASFHPTVKAAGPVVGCGTAAQASPGSPAVAVAVAVALPTRQPRRADAEQAGLQPGPACTHARP